MKTSNNRGSLLVLCNAAIPVNLILSIKKMGDHVRINYSSDTGQEYLPENHMTFNMVCQRYEDVIDRSNNG